MRKGDKLYSKLSYKIYMLINTEYEILSIFDISSSSSEKDLYYVMSSERYINPFGHPENSIVFDQNDIDILFYTKKEFRKIKLNKINEKR